MYPNAKSSLQELRRRHVYIALMAMSVLFMAFPETVIHPFANASPIQLNVYAWIHLVHLQLVAQIVLNVYDSRPEEAFDNKAYLAFMLYDWIDFGLTCNTEYFKIGPVPITANILSLLGIITVYANEHRVLRIFQKR